MKKNLFFIIFLLVIFFYFFSCRSRGPTGPGVTNTETQPQNPIQIITPTLTPTITATESPTFTYTQFTETNTRTPSFTVTEIFSNTETETHSFTPTSTDTMTTGNTETFTYTCTITDTPTGTFTETFNNTFTHTDTPTDTPTNTYTETYIYIFTQTNTFTITDTFTITNTHTETQTYQATFTATQTPTPFHGSAGINPTLVYGKTGGNTITITYTNGNIKWASSPSSGTLKIKIPVGWSPPSIDPINPGYYSVEVENGALLGQAVNGQEIIVTVRDLLPFTGKITVNYGDKSFGPGAFVDGSGNLIIVVEVDEDGNETQEIDSSPQIYVVPATPTITPTLTPIMGEGTIEITPFILVDGTNANTLLFTYTAGETTWASGMQYGTLRITLPPGFSQPSTEINNAGYFYVTTTGNEWIGTAADGQDMIINVRGLPAYTGQIKVFYGYKNFGGPGAYVTGSGTIQIMVKTNPAGDQTFPLHILPTVIFIPPTPTITPTYTITSTFTKTPTITETWTITPTFTITETWTISPTFTITENTSMFVFFNSSARIFVTAFTAVLEIL